jgi:hypothetical protein
VTAGEFGPTELPPWVLLILGGLCTSCGGLVEGPGGSDASPVSGEDPLWESWKETAGGDGSNAGECVCSTAAIVELNAPAGAKIYDEPLSVGNFCSDQFEEIANDGCLDLLFSACSSTGECLFLARTNTASLLQLTDTEGSSLRSVEASRESISLQVDRDRIRGEFAFDAQGGARYWGTLDLCSFDARQIDGECEGQ